MFVGHLPSGYLVAKAIQTTKLPISIKSVTLASLIGSILPDADMIYFYTADHRQHLHHSYWTHIPLFWFIFFVLWIFCGKIACNKKFNTAGLIIFLNVMIHLALDTLTGRIRWLCPFSSHDFVLVDVPAVHSWWVWNFFAHWTFIVEVILVIVAVFLYSRGDRYSHNNRIDTEFA
jgi:inner membrane protein